MQESACQTTIFADINNLSWTVLEVQPEIILFTFRPAKARPFLKRPLTQPGRMLSDNSASASAFVYSCIFSKQKERLPNNLSKTQQLIQHKDEWWSLFQIKMNSYLNSFGLYLIASVKYPTALLKSPALANWFPISMSNKKKRTFHCKSQFNIYL